ncbi:baseplate J/gp47 family protein [Parerythrobacter jejuensis]|uniref:Putative baseplate assembly protein n=1 Tax=Parerythrobacter jejuensis TaxID=795812 RepID=A0A845APZ4_9SPHN|nr:baseplate J/gp47 family protein [Parerythrobacter jejuensis]MXP31263.1 putative baseplate assembly protein [Parerythrobacter jejuensis]MXP34023.1 putative baseplate assembly protein [Parerythrobacter jejuensis]
MPIKPPALDDLDFERLQADLLARIPAHTPEWTAPQTGDPGLTILQLFSWLGDNILYRANLIPERQRLAFLRLLGLQMRPALPARGLVQMQFDNPAQLASADFRKGVRIDQPMPFEVQNEIEVMPVEGQCFIKRAPSISEQQQLAGLLPDLQELFAIDASVAGYVTTPIFADNKADRTGVDILGDSVDGALWVALLAPDPEPATVAAALATLGGGEDNRAATLSMGVAPSMATPEFGETIGIREPIPQVWEVCTGRGEGNQYLPLDMLADSTAGLTRNGVVRLLLPGKDDMGAPSNDVADAYQAGVGDRPPRIDDPVMAARLVTWLRMRPDSATAAGKLSLGWAGPNCAEIEQRRSYGRQTIGRGTGSSGQEFELGVGAIEPASLQLAVEEQSGLVPYRQVPEIGAAGAGERVYTLDSEAGTVRFGDGIHGKAPEAGRAVQVISMRAGGGREGNLPAGSLAQFPAQSGKPKIKLNQPLALAGGLDAETMEAAEQRIPATIRHRDRAVTASDIHTLAAATPGVPVARVEVLEHFRPHNRETTMPGAVSVMMLPASTRSRAPAPRPDRPMLETLHRWLDERRPLATELYVVAPEYRAIGVTVAVELVDQDRREELLQMVTNRLHQLIWPLQPGGLQGGGWELGKTIEARALELAIGQLPGIRSVAPIRLFTGQDSDWREVKANADGNVVIELKKWQLPELISAGVSTGTVAADSVPAAHASSGSSSDAVPVPVVPEHC